MSVEKVGSGSQGSNLIARLYSIQDNGGLPNNTVQGIVTNIISTGFQKATTTCEQSFLASQGISINCDNTSIGSLVSNNRNCEYCLANVATVEKDRELLEQQAFTLNPSYVVQSASDEIVNTIKGRDGTYVNGICKYVCQQCVVENVDQKLVLQVTNECLVTTDQFISTFSNAMTNEASTYISEYREVLNTTGTQIETDLDVDTLSVSMSNTLKSMVSLTTLQSLQSAAIAIQEMNISSGSTSIAVDNLSQSMSVTQLNSLTSAIFTDARIRNSIDYDIQKEQIKIQTDFNNLVRALKTSVDNLQDILNTSLGKLIMIVAGILLTSVVVLVFVFILKPNSVFGNGGATNKYKVSSSR